MNKHDILSDEELKMLLSRVDDADVELRIQNNPTFMPRSVRHKKRENFWDKLFKKTPM